MSNIDDKNKFNIIIIGAGLSGLYAANILYENNIKDFCIIEARDRIGGRLLTKHNDDNDNYVDLGGSYVGPTQYYMQNLIKKLDIKTYKINTNGKSIYMNQKQRYLHNENKLPSLKNKFIEWEINRIINKIKNLSEKISRDEPWTYSLANKFDQKTLSEYLNEKCWTKEARDFISIYIGCCTASESYEQSLLWTLWYIKQCDGLDILYNIDGSAQDSKLIGGTQQICEKIIKIIGNDKIKLSKPVVNIDINNEKNLSKKIQIKTLDNKLYCCSYIIMAIPPILVQKIHFNPELPPDYNQMIQKFSMGSAIKCIVYYKEQFWQQSMLNGNMLINCNEFSDGPITYTLDDTKPDGSYPAIVGFIIGDRARKMLQYTREERLLLICKNFARAFNTSKALKPIDYEEKNWMSEQYTGGCFTGIGQNGFLTNYGKLLKQSLFNDCIFPASTETSTHWSGFMEGALQSGERAALHILSKLNNNNL